MSPNEYEAMAKKLDAEIGLTPSKSVAQTSSKRAIDDILIDTHRNAPKPSKSCLYGLVGDIAKAGSENTEANAFAVAASALAYLGTAVGRGPYMPIGDDWNHARLFMVHVGRSSRGRKGTAKKLVIHHIAKAVMAISQHLAPAVHTGGLSTREGLALMIHDGYKDGKNEIPAIEDKRLLAVEYEFANLLHQSRRDGNTLSPALRDAWDGVSLKPATKSNRVWASDPHIGILADITPSELLGLMASRELTNGFANRFVFFWAEGDKVNPYPQPTPSEVVQSLAERIADVLTFAGADRHVERDRQRMVFSKEAANLYANLYRGELRDRSAGEKVSALLDRRAPVLLRMAMIFALTDLTTTIDVRHIEAAMAWVRYWTDSVKFIFQSAMDEVAVAEVNEAAQQVMEYLKKTGRSSRTGISKGCFSGHLSRDKLDKALDELLAATPPLIEVETVARPKGQSGSGTKFYTLCEISAKSANYEFPCGFQPDHDSRELSVPSEVSSNLISQSSHNSRTQVVLQTRVDVEVPHDSHTSHPQWDVRKSYADDSEVF